MTHRLLKSMLVTALLSGFFSGQLRANVTYDFYNITNNCSVDIAANFEMMVSKDSSDPDVVRFTFNNIGTDDSFIMGVYFDDGALLNSDFEIVDSTETEFKQITNPSDLPGGNELDPPFVTTNHYKARKDGSAGDGVNSGESLSVLFTLNDPNTFADVIEQLNSHTMRIGIHVGGIGPDGECSDSFVNLVPAPGAIILAGIGISLVGWLRRRRSL